MPAKSYSEDGQTCDVTFSLPVSVRAMTVHLCGDFNHWSKTSHPMAQQPDGSFMLVLTLDTGRVYHFRYLVNGEFWENDWDADWYNPNPYGGDNSVIRV